MPLSAHDFPRGTVDLEYTVGREVPWVKPVWSKGGSQCTPAIASATLERVELGKCELHANAHLPAARLLCCQRLRQAKGVRALLEQRVGLQLWVECLAV